MEPKVFKSSFSGHKLVKALKNRMYALKYTSNIYFRNKGYDSILWAVLQLCFSFSNGLAMEDSG